MVSGFWPFQEIWTIRLKNLKASEFRATGGLPTWFFITFWCHVNLFYYSNSVFKLQYRMRNSGEELKLARYTSTWQGHG